MKNTIKWNALIGFCVIALFLAGCASGTKVTMTTEKYTPSFRAGDYKRYKAKRLVISSFTNQAQNTKTYNYSSPDNKLTYEGNVKLEDFYLSGFTKAFKHIGVNLVDYDYDNDYRDRHGYRHGYRYGYGWGVPGPGGYKAPKGVAEFQFVILSLTDQELKFKVLLFKDGSTKLEKEYKVTMTGAATDNVAELERRGYQMVDLAFTTVMRDRDFQRTF